MPAIHICILCVYLYSGYTLFLARETALKSVSVQCRFILTHFEFLYTAWNAVSVKTNRFFSKFTLYLQVLLQVFLVVKIAQNYNNKLTTTKNNLFCALVFPNGILVCTIFWCLYFVNRELVYPQELDEYFPSWQNHIGHSFILLPIALELFCSKNTFKNYPNYKTCSFAMNLLTIVHHIW